MASPWQSALLLVMLLGLIPTVSSGPIGGFTAYSSCVGACWVGNWAVSLAVIQPMGSYARIGLQSPRGATQMMMMMFILGLEGWHHWWFGGFKAKEAVDNDMFAQELALHRGGL